MGYQSFRSSRGRNGVRTGNFGSYGGGRNSRAPKKQVYKVHPDKYINKAATVEEVAYASTNQFADFALLPELKESLARRGYKTPTPIQDQAIPLALTGQDLIGLASTGTGKTAAFVLPTIHRLKQAGGNAVALFIAPTRELANQIDEECRAFTQSIGMKTAICVGGTNIRPQKDMLRRNPQLIIGTPGRLKDLHQQRYLPLSHVSVLVLDEFDRLMDMGFLPDIKFLVQQTPQNRQTLGFSATSNPQVVNNLNTMMRNPQIVKVQQNESSKHIEQEVIHANSKDHKITLLQDLLRKEEYNKVLVFGRTKWGVQKLSELLTKNGHRALAIHGNKSQSQRQSALLAFKQDRVNTLIATDVAARGLDIPSVSHVINFDEPENYEDYIHRIGRTGRAGKHGHAVTIIHRER